MGTTASNGRSAAATISAAAVSGWRKSSANDPSNAPVVQVVVTGAGYTGPQLYDYAFNNIEPLLEGISGVASAAVDGGRMRQINVVVDPGETKTVTFKADKQGVFPYYCTNFCSALHQEMQGYLIVKKK